ncbi:CopG family transcriptional regulator [Govanella unica]|uniref:CopG family transcriptional regulator n=1 Tax=Govanella unica TaxID=2975056 RepID=A0A9X3TXX2_9PROT|nr:CopG family transcriptional regulator [Govania unica]MDA5193707.1 CopG family transcriptional regulator [Govania unica]
MKPRLNVHVSFELFDKVTVLARRPGLTKASVVEAALLSFFAKQDEDHRDGALTRRLDRLTRQFDRLERNQAIGLETLALHIRFFLTVTPPLPHGEQDAAKVVGDERFNYFVRQLGRRLAGGKNLIRDVLEDVVRDEEELLPAGEPRDD